jgi:hypothetical protein
MAILAKRFVEASLPRHPAFPPRSARFLKRAPTHRAASPQGAILRSLGGRTFRSDITHPFLLFVQAGLEPGSQAKRAIFGFFPPFVAPSSPRHLRLLTSPRAAILSPIRRVPSEAGGRGPFFGLRCSPTGLPTGDTRTTSTATSQSRTQIPGSRREHAGVGLTSPTIPARSTTKSTPAFSKN